MCNILTQETGNELKLGNIHNEDVCNVCCLRNAIRVIMSKEERISRTYSSNDRLKTHTFLAENLMGEGHLRDLDADVRVILRWILRKEFVSV
jgi:hypothetical protein